MRELPEAPILLGIKHDPTEAGSAPTLFEKEMLPLLRCIAAPGTGPHQPHERKAKSPGTCNGILVLQDPTKLLCTQCGTIYTITNQIPELLLDTAASTHYLDDETIQCYYEAHFSPYLRYTNELQRRLTFPQEKIRRRARRSPPVEEARPLDTADSTDGTYTSAFYQSIAHLIAEQSLTDEFYRRMLEWCRPYLQENTMVLDVGCGLGRMTGEMARFGARLVVGLDRSPRMAQEAHRILAAADPVPVALNMIGSDRIHACLDLSWDLDNYGILVGDAERLPLRAGTFDLITCFNLVDRVTDPQRMAAELRRVLKPGGHLIITDPYHWDEQYTPRTNWTPDMATLFNSRHWQRLREADGIPFVVRYYTRRITIYMNHCLIYRKLIRPSSRQTKSS